MKEGWRKFFKPGAILWTCGAVMVGLAVAARKLGDFDLPWHLAFGRLVAAAGAVPATDDLAYTQRPIEYAEFVADLFLYGSMRLGGPLALQVIGGLLAIAVLGVLSWLPNRGPAGPIVASIAMAGASAWFIVRPATFSFLLLSLTLFALETHRSSPNSRCGRWALASLVPLHALWANVHGFVVVGVTVVTMYGAYRFASWAARARAGDWLPSSDGTDLRWTFATTFGVFVASMLNVAGPKLLLGPLRALPDTDRVTEWARTTFSFLLFDEPLAAVFAVVVTVALLFGRDPTTGRRTPNAWDVGVLLLAGVLAASAVRLLAVAAILAAPIVARRLATVITSTSITRAAGHMSPILLAAYFFLRPATSFGIGFEPDHFPEGAVRYVQENPLAGRMWNSSVYGGYLAWRLHPEHRVLIDGRTGWVHSPRIVTLAAQSERQTEAFDSLVSEFKIQWAIIRAVEGEAFGVPLARDLRWVMVYWDDVSAVYVLSDGANGSHASSSYRLLRHLTPMSAVLDLAVRQLRVEDLTYDAQLAVLHAPSSPRAAFLEAAAALGRRDEPAFATAVEQLRRDSNSDEPADLLERSWGQR